MPPRPARPAALAAAAAAALAAACLPLPGNHSLSRRVVFDKQEENTFVDRAGAWCRVSGDAFARVQVGQEHTCAWKEAEADGTGRRAPDARPDPRRMPGRPPALPAGRDR